MPKINKYKNKNGFYIRAAQGGQITTYQVTKEGEKAIKEAGLGSNITPALVQAYKDQGLIFTGGGGPGAISSETQIAPTRASRKTSDSLPSVHEHPSSRLASSRPSAGYSSGGYPPCSSIPASTPRRESPPPRPIELSPVSHQDNRIRVYEQFLGHISHELKDELNEKVSNDRRHVQNDFIRDQVQPASRIHARKLERQHDSTELSHEQRNLSTKSRRPGSLAFDEPDQFKRQSDTLAVILWSLASFFVIVLLMVLVVLAAKKILDKHVLRWPLHSDRFFSRAEKVSPTWCSQREER